MLVYRYDENGIFTHVEDAEIDPLESKLKGENVYILPADGTFEAPTLDDGFVSVWNGETWELIEDNRGTKYWLPEDKYGDQPRTMTELGKLPDGATLIAPEQPIEELQAKIQAELTNAVQHVLDAKAQELNYDSCLSVCSYIDTGVQKFDDEGKAFRAWRSQVWAKGYEILAQVQSGKREIPTEDELLTELPELTIHYEETDTPKSSLDYLNSLGQ